MFDLGKGDKEKLEENMEEIKQLVNEGQNQENSQKDELEEISQQVTGENNQESEDEEEGNSIDSNDLEAQIGDQDFSQVEENLDTEPENSLEDIQESADINGSEEDDEENERRNELDQKFEEMQNEIKQEIDSLEKTQEQHGNQRQHSQQTQEEQQTSKQENNPPENQQPEEISTENDMTELDMTQDDKNEKVSEPSREEPLFLEVEKFEDIKKMVEEMHYLTTEMDDVMQHLESGIQDDKETMDESQQIVEEFQARRDRIQQTLRNN